jgi:hypothetical protein
MKLMNDLLLVENSMQAKEVANILKQHCSHYLKKHASDTAFLIRGIKEVKDSEKIPHASTRIYRRKTQSDRTPRDSRAETQKCWDDFFKKEFGIKFRSENVAFCYTNAKRKRAPDDYGETYIVIPVGTDYKMCYSKKVDDFFQELEPAQVHVDNMRDVIFAKSDGGVDQCRKVAKLNEYIVQKDGYHENDDLEYMFTSLYANYLSPFRKDSNAIAEIVDEYGKCFKDGTAQSDAIYAIVDNYDELFETICKLVDYQAGDFQLSEIPRSEIMVHCKEFLAISISLLDVVQDAIKQINS